MGRPSGSETPESQRNTEPNAVRNADGLQTILAEHGNYLATLDAQRREGVR